ncbi:hypothetical protein ACJZ2D_000537 [Fusarium nematophilum]
MGSSRLFASALAILAVGVVNAGLCHPSSVSTSSAAQSTSSTASETFTEAATSISISSSTDTALTSDEGTSTSLLSSALTDTTSDYHSITTSTLISITSTTNLADTSSSLPATTTTIREPPTPCSVDDDCIVVPGACAMGLCACIDLLCQQTATAGDPECTSDADFQAINGGLNPFCSQEGRCVSTLPGDDCSVDSDCSSGYQCFEGTCVMPF